MSLYIIILTCMYRLIRVYLVSRANEAMFCFISFIYVGSWVLYLIKSLCGL
jgi:hypothetical protein